MIILTLITLALAVPAYWLALRYNMHMFQLNTYMNNDGTFQDPQNYDTSGTVIEEDPQFKDPANGEFTIGGATQIARRTGDPRWLPEN